MKLAGAAYLMFLGVQAVRHRRSLATALGAQAEQKTAARIVLDGFTARATNPKVIVFFAAVALLSDSTWALVAGTARAWLARSPRRLELVGGVGGQAIIGICARLALTGRNDLRTAHGRLPLAVSSEPDITPDGCSLGTAAKARR